ncbi:MAG: prolyl oligopeptidase family serine peptidase [candidate division Zixibacteria bacterium]|nr:prolyl oligopeptidase family serine peptidase [candidate division Zixibacteria bacterium]
MIRANISRLLILLALIIPTETFATEFCTTGHVQGFGKPDTVIETIHGITVTDPFRWLENGGGKKAQEWLDSQHIYARACLSQSDLNGDILHRLQVLQALEKTELPREANGRFFYLKRNAGAALPALYMRIGVDGAERMLLDPKIIDSALSTTIELIDFSSEGNLLVYALRSNGAQETTIRIFDVDKALTLPDSLAASIYFAGSVILSPQRTGLYYSRQEIDGPRVYYHRIGSASQTDSLIFGQGYESNKYISLSKSQFGRHVTLTVHHGFGALRTEVYLLDPYKPDSIVTVVNNIDARFIPYALGNRIYLHTDWQAPYGRLLVVEAQNPRQENWLEFLPEEAGVIDAVTFSGSQICVRYLQGVLTALKFFDLEGAFTREFTFSEIGTIGLPSGLYSSDTLFFEYSSFVHPPEIYWYSVANGSKGIWVESANKMKRDQFVTKQVWYQSSDSVEIPMFITHRKGLSLDGSHAALIIAPGGQGKSMLPFFSEINQIWLENGGLLAVLNLRGGGEFGSEWHRAAVSENRVIAVNDCVAAAEWLTEQKYTNSSRMAIFGSGIGGLTVISAMLHKPNLFSSVVCESPLADLVRFGNFSLGRLWESELGYSSDSTDFSRLFASSPCQNVQYRDYTDMLFVTGNETSYIDDAHTRKITASIQSIISVNYPAFYLGQKAHDPAIHSFIERKILLERDILAFFFRFKHSNWPDSFRTE